MYFKQIDNIFHCQAAIYFPEKDIHANDKEHLKSLRVVARGVRI